MATTAIPVGGISRAVRSQSPTFRERDCVSWKWMRWQLVRSRGGSSKEMMSPFRRNLMLNPSADKRAPRITCSFTRAKHCDGDCGFTRHWVVATLRNSFHLPREYTPLGDDGGQEEWGAYVLLRYIVFSLVGVLGGFSMLLSLASEPALGSPGHEFVEPTSEVDETAFLGCPARGRAAPLSVLLR